MTQIHIWVRRRQLVDELWVVCWSSTDGTEMGQRPGQELISQSRLL